MSIPYTPFSFTKSPVIEQPHHSRPISVSTVCLTLQRPILLGELPSCRLNRVHSNLESVLGLLRHVVHGIGRGVRLLVRPLDVERVQLQSRVQTIYVLVLVGGEALKWRDEGEEFVDVVTA